MWCSVCKRTVLFSSHSLSLQSCFPYQDVCLLQQGRPSCRLPDTLRPATITKQIRDMCTDTQVPALALRDHCCCTCMWFHPCCSPADLSIHNSFYFPKVACCDLDRNNMAYQEYLFVQTQRCRSSSWLSWGRCMWCPCWWVEWGSSRTPNQARRLWLGRSPLHGLETNQIADRLSMSSKRL